MRYAIIRRVLRCDATRGICITPVALDIRPRKGAVCIIEILFSCRIGPSGAVRRRRQQRREPFEIGHYRIRHRYSRLTDELHAQRPKLAKFIPSGASSHRGRTRRRGPPGIRRSGSV